MKKIRWKHFSCRELGTISGDGGATRNLPSDGGAVPRDHTWVNSARKSVFEI